MLQLHMIPAGGDATLLRYEEPGTEINILIDGGNRNDRCLQYLRLIGVNHLDLLIISHLDVIIQGA